MPDSTKYNFDTPLDRRGTDSIKWDYATFLFPDAPKDALSFWVADMDFPVAQPILHAMKKRLEHPAFGYTRHQTPHYLETVKSWYERRFDWRFPSEAVLFSPGIVKAISFAIRAFTQPGQGVLIQRPVYKPFFTMVELNGRRVVNNPLVYEEGGYTIDFEDFEAKVADPETRLFLLCSPHNPTGRVFTREELRRMYELCHRHDVVLFSDEIHGDLVRGDQAHLPLTKAVPEAKEEAIVALAPSKTFNIPGLQMSNIVIEGEKLRAQFQKELEMLFLLGGNVFGGVATLAAYEHGDSWLDQVLAYLDGNLHALKAALAEKLPGVHVVHPEGTYLAWLDFASYGLSVKELQGRMVQKAKVLLSPGTMFGPEGEGFLRMNFATARPRLLEGIERMSQVLP